MRPSGWLNAALWCIAASLAQAAPFAYVTNEKSGTISVIDTVSDTVVGEIRAGKKPRGAAFASDGKLLFVSDQPNNNLMVVDVEGRKVVATIALGDSPEGVYASSDGTLLAAAIEEHNAVVFVDPASLGVKWRFIQDQFRPRSGLDAFYRLLIHKKPDDPRVRLQMVVADKPRAALLEQRLIGRRHGALFRALPTSARAPALFLHLTIEAFAVDRETTVANDVILLV